MGDVFLTLQDFMTFTKGVTYLIMVAALCGIGLFWRFLNARDDD